MPKCGPISDSFWVRRLFNVCVRVFCAPNATILLVYIPAQIKMSFTWKDDYFAKIGIFCKSIAGRLPSVVQAYTQPYSFDGRIKLIICQIRHKLSVTIHDISTNWKSVWWRFYNFQDRRIKTILATLEIKFTEDQNQFKWIPKMIIFMIMVLLELFHLRYCLLSICYACQ